MNPKTTIRATAIAALLFSIPMFANDADVKLPPPDKAGGIPLMKTLSLRRSTRKFSSKEPSRQTLSNLLWAAFGVNRPDGKRTAPSAMNWREIDVYVALKEGLYRYDAEKNVLKHILSEDIRAAIGKQAFTRKAPVNLIYVADRSRMTNVDEAMKSFYSAADTGFISQNVYLFCASEELATVVIGMVDRKKLRSIMRLSDNQKIILAQPVGHPE